MRNEGLIGDYIIAEDGAGYALAYKKADYTMGKLQITRLGGVYKAGDLGVQPNLDAVAQAFDGAVRPAAYIVKGTKPPPPKAQPKRPSMDDDFGEDYGQVKVQQNNFKKKKKQYLHVYF